MTQDASRDPRDELLKLSKGDLVQLVIDLRAGKVDGFEIEKFDYVIEQMLLGRSCRSVFRHDEPDDKERAPSQKTFYRWLANSELDKKFDLKRKHAFAFEVRSMDEFDYMFEIADDGQNDWMELLNKDGDFVGWTENGESTRRSSIRIDMRKWALGRMNKGRFSDKAGLGDSQGG